MRKFILSSLLVLTHTAFACTAFGIITNTGTILGKNRDYYYDKQSFELVMPIKQFTAWYDNNYGEHNQFYALISNNDVKMGINAHGLTAIEEDPMPTSNERAYLQPNNGNAEGMILYGILQNFATVDEILPFVQQIFSKAAPNFYQIADGSKILEVEVGYGTSNSAKTRPFTYHIIKQYGTYFVHTNTYLTAQFESLNDLARNKNAVYGAQNRLQRILWLVKNNQNNNEYFKWFLDTKSNLTKTSDNTWCRNTSIFRSNIGESSVNLDHFSNLVGTVSSLIVVNNRTSNNTIIDLKIIQSITPLANHRQYIKYKELKTTLADLFSSKPQKFVEQSFSRTAPVRNHCN